MKRIETFMPEEGDKLVLSCDFPDAGLHAGDIIEYVNSTPMGIVCMYGVKNQQTLFPKNILLGLKDNKTVRLIFR